MSKAKEIITILEQGEQPRLPGIGSEPTPEIMNKLARAAGCQYDSSMGNVMDYEDMIWVDVSEMTEEEYDEMIDKADKLEVVGEGYKIYTHYDYSGYNYWKEQSADQDYQYIGFTVEVTDPDIINPDALRNAIDDARLEFEQYSAFKEY